MKWFKYLQRTSLAQIRADWAEYKNLCRQCASAQDAYNAAYRRIVTPVNEYEKETRDKSCVRHYYNNTDYPVYSGSYDNSADSLVWIRYTECKSFADGKDAKPCTKTDCPYVKDNHEYVDACARLNIIRQARRDFWRHKFAQACQNVK